MGKTKIPKRIKRKSKNEAQTQPNWREKDPKNKSYVGGKPVNYLEIDEKFNSLSGASIVGGQVVGNDLILKKDDGSTITLAGIVNSVSSGLMVNGGVDLELTKDDGTTVTITNVNPPLTITGEFLGSSATFAGLPIPSNASNGDFAILTLKDGSNERGIYVYDGTNFQFVTFLDEKFTLPISTKGDLLTHDGVNPIRLSVGTNGQVLIADPTQVNGLKWADENNTYVQSGTVLGRDVVLTMNDSSTVNIRNVLNSVLSGQMINNGVDLELTKEDGTTVTITNVNPPLTITGEFLGSSSTFAGLPTPTNASNGDFAILTTKDGAKERGIYVYDGTNFQFVTFLDEKFTLPISTKGDLLTHDGVNPIRLSVGLDGQILKADSNEPDGILWADDVGAYTQLERIAGVGSFDFNVLSVLNSHLISVDNGATISNYPLDITPIGDTIVRWTANNYPNDTNGVMEVFDHGGSRAFRRYRQSDVWSDWVEIDNHYGKHIVTQVAHGFDVFQAIYKEDSNYRLLNVNDDNMTGIITRVIDVDSFEYAEPYTRFNISDFYSYTNPTIGYINDNEDGIITPNKSLKYKQVAITFGDGFAIGILQDTVIPPSNPLLTGDGYKKINLFGELANNTIRSFTDNNVIYQDGLEIATLNTGEEHVVVGSVSEGQVFSAKGAFDVIGGNATNGLNTITYGSKEYAGKEFNISYTRSSPHTTRLYAFEDTNIQWYEDGMLVNEFFMPQGEFKAIINPAYVSIKIKATGVIIGSVTSLNYTDHAILIPVKNELFGFASNSAWTIANGNATINIVGSDSDSNFTVTNGIRTNNNFGAGTKYNGQALRYSSDVPFISNSLGDGDGSQMAYFQPWEYATTKYITPIHCSYVALISKEAGNVTLTPPAGQSFDFDNPNTSLPYGVDEVANVTFERTNLNPQAPYKGYFGSDVTTNQNIVIPAGTTIESTVDCLKWVESYGDSTYIYGYDDENVVIGFNPSDTFYTDYDGSDQIKAIKHKVFYVNSGTNIGDTTSIPHVMDINKIVSVEGSVIDNNGVLVKANDIINAINTQYSIRLDANNINVVMDGANSGDMLNKIVKVVISYV